MFNPFNFLFRRNSKPAPKKHREPVQNIVDAINNGSLYITLTESGRKLGINPITHITLEGLALGMGILKLDRELNWYTDEPDNAEIFFYRSNAEWMDADDIRIILHAAQRYYESEVH